MIAFNSTYFYLIVCYVHMKIFLLYMCNISFIFIIFSFSVGFLFLEFHIPWGASNKKSSFTSLSELHRIKWTYSFILVITRASIETEIYFFATYWFLS